MVDIGLILATPNGKGTVYHVQKIQVDKQKVTELLELLEPLIKEMYSELDLQQVKDPEEALGNNLALFISRKVINVK